MNITEIISRYDEHVEYVENIRKCELSFERAKKELPNEFVTHFELQNTAKTRQSLQAFAMQGKWTLTATNLTS